MGRIPNRNKYVHIKADPEFYNVLNTWQKKLSKSLNLRSLGQQKTTQLMARSGFLSGIPKLINNDKRKFRKKR